MRYELTDLRLFLAVVEAGSLSNGAADSHISAPSASYRLKKLEQAVGAPLFVRDPRGMVLTPAGNVFCSHVRTILGAVKYMDADIAQFSSGLKGHIRIAANSSCLSGVTDIAGSFLSSHPDVNLELEEHLSATIVSKVAEKSVDIGLLAGDVNVQELQSVVYGEDELIFVASKQHPLSGLSKITFAQTVEEDFIGLDRKSSNHVFLSQMAANLGRRLNVRVNVQSFPVVLKLVEQGVGVSIIPRSVAVNSIKEGGVIGIRLDETWAMRTQRMVALDFDSAPNYVKEFFKYLIRQFPASE